jgi:hypothetical protein
MRFNPAALAVLAGFVALLALALSSRGGARFHAAEAVATVIILLGVAGFLGWRGVRAR